MREGDLRPTGGLRYWVLQAQSRLHKIKKRPSWTLLEIALGTAVSLALFVVSALSFAKRNNLVTLKEWLGAIADAYHQLTYAITQVAVRLIPFDWITLTPALSDFLWLWGILALPAYRLARIAHRQDASKSLLYLLLLMGYGFPLFIVFAHKTSPVPLWVYILASPIIILQYSLTLYLRGGDNRSAAIRSIRNIVGAALLIALFYFAGLVDLLT